jgi:UDP-glucose 4-epimerase
MTILITGSAGYIGSHICLALEKKGLPYVGVDNLTRGKSVVNQLRFVKCDIGDWNGISSILKRDKISTVIHLAAFAYVQESISFPLKYYENNVEKTINFARNCVENSVRNFIFSSSCAVYGNPDRLPISERQVPAPISPYGHSKLVIEDFLNHISDAHGISICSLRYFNAAGASCCGSLKEEHNPETHIIPLAVDAALGGKELTIFGNELNTEDGSPVRDFIHVDDLASAHIAARKFLLNNPGSYQFNIGSGIPVSLNQVVEEIRSQGLNLKVAFSEPRPGDPHRLFADPTLALKSLNWAPEFSSLKKIVSTTIRSRTGNDA